MWLAHEVPRMKLSNTNMKEVTQYLSGGVSNTYLMTSDGLFIPLGSLVFHQSGHGPETAVSTKVKRRPIK
jgi:hypothetical protein